MKNNKVKELLDKRKIAYSVKDSKFGETIYQCVIFRKIAKITENSNTILIEFPFHDFPQKRVSTMRDFELYLDNGANDGKALW